MHVHVLSIIVIFFCSIVQAFDNIVESLMEFKKFTNISVNGDDLLLRGERVSKTFYIDYIQMSCNIIVSRYLETSIREELFLLVLYKVIVTRV